MPFGGDLSSKLELFIPLTYFGLSYLRDGINQWKLEVIAGGQGIFYEHVEAVQVLGLFTEVLFDFKECWC